MACHVRSDWRSSTETRMDISREAIVGRVLFNIAADVEAASHVRSRELHVLEGVLALALERIRTELYLRDPTKSDPEPNGLSEAAS